MEQEYITASAMQPADRLPHRYCAQAAKPAAAVAFLSSVISRIASRSQNFGTSASGLPSRCSATAR